MTSVFLLWHSHDDDDKLIGVYARRADAEAAIVRVKDKPGFRDTPDGFLIDEYAVGQDNWSEGYISWEEAMKEGDS